MSEKRQKPIKHNIDSWREIRALTNELRSERGGNISMQDTVAEAVKFYRSKRPKSRVAA